MNKNVILFGIGLALLLDGQILAMKNVRGDDGSTNVNSSAFMSVSKQKTKRLKSMRNAYLRNLEKSNFRLVEEVKSLAAEVQSMKSMLLEKFANTSNMGVQTSPDRSDIDTQSFNGNSEQESHELSLSESESQNEQVSDMTTDEENSENHLLQNIADSELTFLERNFDNIQLGKIVGSVGAQFPTTQLNAAVLCTDKNPDDKNYIDSFHYFTLVIHNINGSDQMPGSVSYSRVTIGGSHDGSTWTKDITGNQNLSTSLVSLVISAISYRQDLEYLRVGLREVGVSI